MRLQARNVLVVFPDTYSLSSAVDIVKAWSPDTLEYDLVNGKPFIHTKISPPFNTGVRRLYEKGVRFMTGNQITHIPHLSNPPLNNTRTSEQQQQHQEPAEIHPAEIHSHTEFNTLLQSINSLRDENQNLRGLIGELQRKIQDIESQLKRKPILQDVQLPVASIPTRGSQPMAIEREYSYIYY